MSRRDILDTSAKSLDESAKYFGHVGEILGRVSEIILMCRRRFGHLVGTRLVASERIPLRRHIFWTPRNITFVASVRSLFSEMCFQDVVYISLYSMA